jgi:hypothetical protein
VKYKKRRRKEKIMRKRKRKEQGIRLSDYKTKNM